MTEQQRYQLVRRYADVEIRRYPAHTVAEVEVAASFDRAANAAFGRLFRYIGGDNTARTSIAMTAPVVQRGRPPQAGSSEKVRMTAPVLQRQEAGAADGGAHAATYVVAFVLPAGMTEDTAPLPNDPRVTIRSVPESVAAAVRFSGGGSEAAFAKHNDALQAAIAAAGLTPTGPPRFARFDPPFKPWFLRRNEVVQDVEPE